MNTCTHGKYGKRMVLGLQNWALKKYPIKVIHETPVWPIANVIAKHYDTVLSHTILPTASLHQCIKYLIATFFLNALFHTIVTTHCPALVLKAEVIVSSIFPIALKYLSASQTLLSFLDTQWSKGMLYSHRTERAEVQSLKSKAVFPRAPSEIFSFVRIIIVPYVWYKETLLVTVSVLWVWKSV